MPTNNWEQLQSVLMKVYNREVRENFREDIPDDDITTPESALKYACLIKDNDSVAMAQLRMMLFYNVRNKGSQLPEIWTIPDFQPDVYNATRPQVIMLFAEKDDDYKRRKADRRKVVRVSFRLMNETSESLTEANINTLRNKINLEFPRSYFWTTGTYKCTYTDKENGLSLILPPESPGEGKSFVNKVLDVVGVPFDGDKWSVSNRPAQNFRERKTKYVAAQQKAVNLPNRRPTAKVYLDKVELNIYGTQGNYLLIDRYISHRRFSNRSQYL